MPTKAAAPPDTKDALIRRVREQRNRIRDLGVRRLAVFGSFARDQADPTSDVDFLVDFETGMKSFDRFMELAFLLEELTQRRVELLTRESLSPQIGPRILEQLEDVPLGA